MIMQKTFLPKKGNLNTPEIKQNSQELKNAEN